MKWFGDFVADYRKALGQLKADDRAAMAAVEQDGPPFFNGADSPVDYAAIVGVGRPFTPR